MAQRDELRSKPFAYSNHSRRGQSRMLRVASTFLPGLGKVQAQVRPYAEAWMAANAQALKRTSEPLWVVLGDSMSQGIGASSFQHGWVGQLDKRLKQQGRQYRIVNLSISGARLEDVLQIEIPAMRRLGVTPSLVTVLIGANNLLRSKYRRHMGHEVREMLALLPDRSIIGSFTGTSPEAAAANSALAQSAARRNFQVADMNDAFRRPYSRHKLATDRFHPNDIGYADVARVFAEAINRLDDADGSAAPAAEAARQTESDPTPERK